ncbi:hypothetical protein [uncultured Nostoc sp.]|uniref:hypothetical protein n=1 Tax=uncultured Nostoc sp. TaxID=340711 RepID=UPI0035CA8F8B
MEISKLKTLAIPSLNDVLPILDINGGVSGKPLLKKATLGSLLALVEPNNGGNESTSNFTVPTITKTTAANDDYIILIDETGRPYKIKKSDLLAGLSSGSSSSSSTGTGTASNVVFVSNFNSIVDAKNHAINIYGNTAISTAQSKFNGSSIYFDGDGDYLQLVDSNDWDFGTTDFTIEAWLYPTDKRSSNGKDNVILSTAFFNNSGWQLETNSATVAGNKALSFFIGQYQNRVFVDDGEWINSWKYIAVKRSGATL